MVATLGRPGQGLGGSRRVTGSPLTWRDSDGDSENGRSVSRPSFAVGASGDCRGWAYLHRTWPAVRRKGLGGGRIFGPRATTGPDGPLPGGSGPLQGQEKEFSFFRGTFSRDVRPIGREGFLVWHDRKRINPWPNARATPCTEVELEFMLVIWELGRGRHRRRVGRPRPAGATPGQQVHFRKILSILVTKGYVSRRPADGRGFRYRRWWRRTRPARDMLLDVVDREFEGSAALMVAALLDTKKVHDGRPSEDQGTDRQARKGVRPCWTGG